jgi:hypothetical protein
MGDLNTEFIGKEIPPFSGSDKAQLDIMNRRYYRNNGPNNDKFTKILLLPGTKGTYRIDGKSHKIDTPSINAHTNEGIALRQDIITGLDDLKLDKRHIGSSDWSTIQSFPGMRGREVLVVHKDGRIISLTEGKRDQSLVEAWAIELKEHADILFDKPLFEPLKMTVPSFSGPLLNAANGTEKLQNIHYCLTHDVRPSRVLLALISRLQNDGAHKVGTRQGVDDNDNVIFIDNSMKNIIKDMNMPWLTPESRAKLEGFHGQRHRTAYAADSYMTMLENFCVLPLMNNAYKSAEFLLKHRSRSEVLDKVNKKKYWRKMDMGNWDQTIPKEVIHMFIDMVKDRVPESHYWRYDAYKNGFVTNWLDYEGQLNTQLMDSNFNASGWSFVSPLARFAMISFLTLVGKLTPKETIASHKPSFHGGIGEVIALCEGDDTIVGSDSEEALNSFCDMADQLAESLKLKLEWEDELVFRGDNFDVSEAGHYTAYARLGAHAEKLFSPEYSLAASLEFAPIGHEARKAHAKSNPSFDVYWKRIKEVVGDHIGDDLDIVWEARKAHLPKEVLSFNAATIAFLQDPAIIYKGRGIDINDVDERVLKKQFLTYPKEVVEQFYTEGNHKSLAEALIGLSKSKEMTISDTSFLSEGRESDGDDFQTSELNSRVFHTALADEQDRNDTETFLADIEEEE